MWDHILQLYYMCISNQIHNFKIVATVLVELKIVQSVYVFKLTGWSTCILIIPKCQFEVR